MAVIGAIAVNVLAQKLDKFEADMKRAGKASERMADRSRKAIALLGAGIKGLIVGGGLKLLASQFNETAAEIDSIAKTAAKLGATTQTIIGLQHAGEQTGVAMRTTDMAMQRLTRRASEAAIGLGEAKGALAELGIDAVSFNRLTLDKKMLELSRAMAKVENQSDKVRIAFKLFDSEGVSLVNTLNAGESALKAYFAESKKLDAFSADEAKKLENYNDQLDKLAKAWRGLKRESAIAAAPVATGVVNSARVGVESIKSPFRAAGIFRDAFRDSITERFSRDSLGESNGSGPKAGYVPPRSFEQRRAGAARARERERLRVQSLEIKRIYGDNPFPVLSGSVAPHANRESLKGAGGVAAKIGKAVGKDLTAGFEKVYRKFRFSYTPLGALQAATGIPIEDIAKGKRRRSRTRDEKNEPATDVLSPLRAVTANSSSGFAALRRNMMDGDLQSRQLKAQEEIARNTRSLREPLKEEGI